LRRYYRTTPTISSIKPLKVNLFFHGASTQILTETLPPFELRKLSIRKLSFDIEPMIDTLVRYKEKGSYAGKMGNNPEQVIAEFLDDLGLTYKTGDLKSLLGSFEDKRTMDFIIPDKSDPRIIIECSYLTTTSSGQGDKSKTERGIQRLIKEHYPFARFIGFVDGIGWYVRKGDWRRMVSSYEDVFTFHPSELERFRKLVYEVFDL